MHQRSVGSLAAHPSFAFFVACHSRRQLSGFAVESTSIRVLGFAGKPRHEQFGLTLYS